MKSRHHIFWSLFVLFLGLNGGVAQAQSDEAFKKSLHFADSVFQRKEYENAKSAYEYAARFQANNDHIRSRLAEIERILSAQAATEKQYKTAVDDAKKALYINDLAAAEQALRRAVALRDDPGSWANQTLEEMETAAATKAQLQSDFRAKMDAGTQLMAQKNYEAAEQSFAEALRLMPNDTDATQKRQEAQQKIRARDAEYQQYITEGDRLYKSDQVDEAKAEYQRALALKPTENYPKQRVEQIDAMQAEEAALENRIAAVLQEADKLFTNKQFEEAYTQYRAALDVVPGHRHSQERIREIDNILGEARIQQRNYDQAIAEADQLFEQQRFTEARAKYEVAAAAKTTESYPKQKIDEIDQIFARQQADSEAFTQLVAQGDQHVAQEAWMAAKTAYEQALKMRPNDAGVTTKYNNVNNQIAKIDRQYTTLISQANTHFTNKKYIDAQVAYESAAQLKPDETLPQERLAEIATILKDQQELLDRTYTEALALGDRQMEQGDFAGAKAEYTKAASIKPKESTPKEKLAALENAVSRQKQLDEQFAALVKEGDSKFSGKRWQEAKTAYEQALQLKTDGAVSEKVARCDEAIAQAAALQEQYNQHVAEGDRHFANQSWSEAKTAYQAAMQIQSSKVLNDKMKEVDAKIAQEAGIEKQYQSLITQANTYFTNKKYIDAQVAYESAAQLKPDETLPQERLAEIATILKDQQELLDRTYTEALALGDRQMEQGDFAGAKAEYTKAASIKPKESTPKEKLAALENAVSRQKQLDEQFAALVKEGDSKFSGKRWQEAKTAYEQALQLKTDGAVSEKVARCDEAIAQAAALQEQYNQHVAEGDRHFANQSWSEAKTAYQAAMQIQSSKALNDKMKEVDAKIAQEAGIEKQYQSLITQANTHFTNKKYIDAQVAYESAAQLKPDETLPQERLAEIATILKDQQELLDRTYTEALALGDQQMEQGDFAGAKAEYTKAASIKPKESTPKEKLAALENAVSRQKQLDEQFAALVKEGDSKFSGKRWQEAKTAYEQALQLKPDGAVSEKVARCDEAIAQAAALQEQYNQHVAEGDRHFANQSWSEAKTAYQAAMQIQSSKALTDKIKEIDLRVIQAADAEKQYQFHFSAAEKYAQEHQWKEAVESYGKALTIKPNDPTATAQSAFAAEQYRLEQERESQYQSWIEAGDAALAAGTLNEAETAYRNALNIKENEDYPTKKLAYIAAQQQAHEQRLERYNTLITGTQNAIQQQDWKQAKKYCEEAQQIFPDETLPTTLMTTINGALAEMAATQEAYNTAMTAAATALSQNDRETAIAQYQRAAELLPNESLPKTKIAEIEAAILAEKNRAIEQQYQALMGEAKQFIINRSYSEALSKLDAALEVKPGDVEAQNRRGEVVSTMQRLEQLEADYAAAIAAGDKSFNNNELEAALKSYEQAAALKPEERYPKTQIEKTRYQMEYSPERRKALADASLEKGINAANKGDYQAATMAFATALKWYPENTTEVQTAMSHLYETLTSGKTKTIVSTATKISANETHNIKTFVGPNELTGKAYIILKISGKAKKDLNLFIRYGRYSVSLGSAILAIPADVEVPYYCIPMQGNEYDINWMTLMPENGEVMLEAVILVGGF